MTKQRALVLAYACTVPCAVCWALNLYMLAALCILLIVVLIGINSYKTMSDNEFIIQAQQEREKSLKTPTQAPTMSEKSRGLFLPPPLN